MNTNTTPSTVTREELDALATERLGHWDTMEKAVRKAYDEWPEDLRKSVMPHQGFAVENAREAAKAAMKNGPGYEPMIAEVAFYNQLVEKNIPTRNFEFHRSVEAYSAWVAKQRISFEWPREVLDRVV